MPTTTTNLSLYKPTVGGDTDLWGGYLNDNTDILDGIFKGDGTGTSVGLNVGTGKTLSIGGTFKVDTIAEKTAAAGVTADGTLLKDGGVGVSAAGAAATPIIYKTDDTNTGAFFPAADTLAFTTGGTERVRFDSSGNVGIGTTSPGELVEASKSQNLKTQVKITNVNAGASASAGVVFGTSSGDSGYIGANGGAASSAFGGASALQINNLLSAPIVLGTNATERLRIDSAGTAIFSNAIQENVYTITDGAAFEIDPRNGTVQLITLGANRTPKATNFAAGQSVTLMVDDGTAYAITWTDATFGGSGVVWKTNAGVAPTLNTTGYTAIMLWKVGTQVYGARVGDA